jgi:hypothetical protein
MTDLKYDQQPHSIPTIEARRRVTQDVRAIDPQDDI